MQIRDVYTYLLRQKCFPPHRAEGISLLIKVFTGKKPGCAGWNDALANLNILGSKSEVVRAHLPHRGQTVTGTGIVSESCSFCVA